MENPGVLSHDGGELGGAAGSLLDGNRGTATLLLRSRGQRLERPGLKPVWAAAVPPKVGPVTAVQGACRLCGAPLRHSLVDLGNTPLEENFPDAREIDAMERFYPLRVMVCERCLLVQLRKQVSSDGAHYDHDSSPPTNSVESVACARANCEALVRRLKLGEGSRVVEIGCARGSQLQQLSACGVPHVLGIESSIHAAAEVMRKDIPVWVGSFGEELARRMVAEHGLADLVLGNGTLARAGDLNDFLQGLRLLLAPGGVAAFELGHLLHLMEGNHFEAISHGNLCYFSGLAVRTAAARHGLVFCDVEELPGRGGTLRVYLAHGGRQEPSPAVQTLLGREEAAGLRRMETYAAFGPRVRAAKRTLLRFLVGAKDAGMRLVAYESAGQGCTLLNYCGIGPDFLDFAVDRNPRRHGRFTPGTHVPVLPVESIDAARPDYVLVLSRDLPPELLTHLRHMRDWGGKLVVPTPVTSVIDPGDPAFLPVAEASPVTLPDPWRSDASAA